MVDYRLGILVRWIEMRNYQNVEYDDMMVGYEDRMVWYAMSAIEVRLK
jgi:hypothetical protein